MPKENQTGGDGAAQHDDDTVINVDEFTANLSVGGIFLPTEHALPERARGTLTFRISQWEQPFTVEAEVVLRKEL